MQRFNRARHVAVKNVRSKPAKLARVRQFKPFTHYFLFFVFCCFAPGCGSVPDTFYYTLDLDAIAPLNDGQPALPFAVGVEKLQAEVIYDDDRIIYRDSPHEIKYYHYRRWVTPPRHLVAEKLLAYLADSGLFERVVAYPAATNVDYVLGGRLLAFEEWDDRDNWYGKIKLKAQLYSPSTRRVIWAAQFEHMQPVEKKIPVAVVQALNIGLKKCFDELARSLAQQLRQAETMR